MSDLNISIWCPKCKNNNIISEYDENKNDIICVCLECNYKDLLKKFDYLIEENRHV